MSSEAVALFFNLLFVPARLRRVILVPALVRGNLLFFAALLFVVADSEPAEDGVLLLHKALPEASSFAMGIGGGLSDDVLMSISFVLSPELPSLLTGLNCPGVKLPLTPRLARLVELPIRSRLAAAESYTSVFRLSK